MGITFLSSLYIPEHFEPQKWPPHHEYVKVFCVLHKLREHIQTDRQAGRQAGRQTDMHTCIHAYMHTCIHAYMHTCVHAYMRTCVRTHIYTDTYTRVHVYMQDNIQQQGTCFWDDWSPLVSFPASHRILHAQSSKPVFKLQESPSVPGDKVSNKTDPQLGCFKITPRVFTLSDLTISNHNPST